MSDPSDGIPARWEPYRDADGNAVTITEEQYRAIWHAVYAVEDIRRSQGVRSLFDAGNASAEIAKSRLLGRMLLEGKRPHLVPPPKYASGGAWWLVPGDVDYKEESEQ